MTHAWQHSPALANSANAFEPFTIRIKSVLFPEMEPWYLDRIGEVFVVTGEAPGIPGNWIVDTSAIADEIPGGYDYAYVLKPDAERTDVQGG
ncbi:MAG: hypothetical protein KDE24_06080 [Caldilinea sp.]|nr:hypothetical protein [Caldilinea sp.]